MVIILDKPFSVGDLSANQYPHVYITTFSVNNPAETVRLTWQVGTVQFDGTWLSAPDVPEGSVNLTGEALAPFFLKKPLTLDESLWAQVSEICYGHIQAAVSRYAGRLGSGLPEDAPMDVAATKQEIAPIVEPADEQGMPMPPPPPALPETPSFDTEIVAAPDESEPEKQEPEPEPESEPSFERVVDA